MQTLDIIEKDKKTIWMSVEYHFQKAFFKGVPKRQICLFNKHQNKLRNQTLNIKQTKG